MPNQTNIDMGGEPPTEAAIEERDKAALERVALDQVGGSTAAPEAAPKELLAGKYSTPEELRKGVENAREVLGLKDNTLNYIKDDNALADYYQDLDKQISTGAHKQPATEPAGDPAPTADGLDIAKYESEYAEKGELSQESYDELQKAGYNPDLVDRLIASEQKLLDQQTESLMQELGGAEQWAQAKAWAQDNIAEEEKVQLNLDLVDPAKQADAARELSKLHRDRTGWSPNNLLTGDRTPPPTGSQDTFFSDADMLIAQKDPKYKTSPEYRDQVAAKIKRSMLAGTIH